MLLDIARLEIGQMALDRQQLELAGLAHRVVDEVRPALVRHSIAFETSQSPVMVEGDELRLIQVLQNLISNAVKYSPDGGAIRVCVASNDGLATMAVSDVGIGIPDEVRPRLFQRFFRVRNFATGNISGLGIDLYIVKEIVERHGGTVAVSSVEGEGSTFSVQLPLAVETPSA